MSGVAYVVNPGTLSSTLSSTFFRSGHPHWWAVLWGWQGDLSALSRFGPYVPDLSRNA